MDITERDSGKRRESVRIGGARLPWALYEMLRLNAYERHVSQNTIITEALERYFEVGEHDRRKGEAHA